MASRTAGTSAYHYFYMTRLPGKALDQPAVEAMSPNQLANMIEGVARFHIGLSALSFRKFGSPLPSTAGQPPSIGFYVDNTFALDEPPLYAGPFKTYRESYFFLIDQALELVSKHYMNTSDPFLFYLAHLDMRDLIGNDDDAGEQDGDTFLAHRDDRGDDFLLDEEGHLTGVIDWEWYVPLPDISAQPSHG